MTDETTDLQTTTGDGGITVLHDADAVEMIMDAGLEPSDLEKITLPSGSGGAFFTIQDASGEEVAAKTIDIVVGYMSPVERAFYARSIEDSDDSGPPDCSSPDERHMGFGVRDVEAILNDEETEPSEQKCKKCSHAQFGSSLKGTNAQACGARQRLIVWHDDCIVPNVLQVPATSLKNLRHYVRVECLNRRVPIYKSVTRISLEKVPGASLDYYRLRFAFVRKLTDEEFARVGGLAAALKEAAEGSSEDGDA